MKQGRLIFLLLCAVIEYSVGQTVAGGEHSLVRFVNPLIGTAPSTTPSALAHGTGTENSAQVIPDVTVPFGMTNWTPQTRQSEQKCVAPYYYDDSLISGFRGSHWLSGSCTQDYGSVTLMPLAGPLHCRPQQRASHYSHAREVSTPYYYSVELDDYHIRGEITATARCGVCRFTFAGSDTGLIVVEPNSDFGEGYIRIFPEKREIVGYNPVHRIYQGWGEPAGFRGYFVARFSEPFAGYGTYEGDGTSEGVREIGGRKNVGGFVRFAGTAGKSIIVRIGTSFTSIEEARTNLAVEAAGIAFDTVKSRLRDQWEAMLSRITVDTGKRSEEEEFYTALYHSLLVPRIYNDCDGSYPRFGGGDSVCNAGGGNYYCDFSLWDTYRALHPLLTLVVPDVNADMVKSLLAMAKQGGWLPIFPCWNSYTSAMIGDHAIAMIADAFVKGVVSLTDEDYGYLKKNATAMPVDRQEYLNGKGVRALDSYLRYGFVPLEDSVKESFHKEEQVSRTLEYAYDDFAMSQIAKGMGKAKDQRYFLDRSNNYRNVFDTARNCVCGRFADGTFTTEFTKTKRMPYITEGTPWQYTWYVPHDVDGLIALMGGREEFNRNLDAFFANGQYWHGNEPDQQVPFLYDFSGQAWKTQKIVRQILADEYSDAPGGLCGNDDAGQISSWYVFASMGLYPVCPSKGEYALVTPAFDRILVHLASGRNLEIRADGQSDGKRYIRAVEFNGKRIDGWQISHAELAGGGVLNFIMADTPAEK